MQSVLATHTKEVYSLINSSMHSYNNSYDKNVSKRLTNLTKMNKILKLNFIH